MLLRCFYLFQGLCGGLTTNKYCASKSCSFFYSQQEAEILFSGREHRHTGTVTYNRELSCSSVMSRIIIVYMGESCVSRLIYSDE